MLRIPQKVGLMVLVMLLGGFIIRVLSLKIQNIVCTFNDDECPTEVINSLASLQQQWLFFSDIEAHAQHLPVGYEIEEYARVLPQSVQIKVTTHPPRYVVKAQDSETILAIDERGKKINTSAELPLLPQVLVPTPDILTIENAGEVSSERHAQVLETVRALEELKIAYQFIEMPLPSVLLVALDERRSAVVNANQPLRDIKKLSLVLKGLGPDKLEAVQEIDVRYRLPVLRQTRSISRHDSH